MKVRKTVLLSRVLVIFVILFLTCCPYYISLAQEDSGSPCAMDGLGNTLSVQRGGRYMTSLDTLNVVVVFVQFPDDKYDTTYTLWPTRPNSGVFSGPNYLKTFIDSTRTQLSTSGNLTHYFREMSRGNFNLIGTARFIVTPHTRQWYLSNNWNRWQINMEVLQTLDANFNFAPFDKYKRYAEYDIRKETDTRVDDIFMIYRNTASEYPVTPIDSVSLVNQRLDFYNGRDGHTFAEATLGYGSPAQFDVDGGLRNISQGFPGSGGIGLGTTTVCTGLSDSWGMPPYRGQIHEFSHHWMDIGTAYGHNGGGFWGMLNAWEVRQNSLCQCPPNSFERELVGWHAPDSIYATTLGVTLTDYVTTNRSIKIKVPGSNAQELFRLEYHTRVSQFDNPEEWDPTAKGLYIIHQTGNTDPYNQLRLIPADGRWTWVADEYVTRSYTTKNLPVLKKSAVDRVNGTDDSRAVNYTWTGGTHPTLENPFWIHVYRDRATNEIIDKTVFLGDGQDAFGFTKNRIISPWSNPNSQNNAKASTGLAIEVVSEDTVSGVITLNIYFSESSALALAPSKPQDIITSLNSNCQAVTNWAANIESDISGYNIYRQLYYGSTTISEVKVNSSNITGTTFTDNIVIPSNTPSGVILYVRYKIEAVDSQTKVSVKAIGNSISLGTTSYVTGTISSNTTWYGGVKIVPVNLQVASGVTLTINPNTFVCFGSNFSLQVDGYLNASNTSFQGLGSSVWYGIIINGPATSNITNCIIKGCKYGIVANTSPVISHCDISADSIGIWIKTYGDPSISNCFIQSSGTAAVLSSNNGRGTISRSKLYGSCTHGHKSENSATTSFAYNNSGRNIIFGINFPGDGYSVYVTGGYPVFNNGYNSIPPRAAFTQYCHTTGSTREIINNYWGGGTPYVSGTVIASPYLTSLPSPLGPDWALSKTGGEGGSVSSDDPLALAWKAFGDNDFSKAIDYAKTTFNNNVSSKSADSKLQAEALFVWMKSTMLNGDLLKTESTLKSLNNGTQYAKSANYEAVRWLAKTAVINDDIKKAEEYALSVPVSSLYCKEILFDAAVETIERWGSLEKANSFFDKIAELYPDKETIKEIELVKNLYGSYLDVTGDIVAKPYTESAATTVPVSMNMFDAYPNPFNPTTTIAYSLTEAAKVNIKIYDILGSEVYSLVDDVKEEGYYTASFNGSNLASGLYFARITINSNSQAPFIKTIKMVLTK